MFGAVKLVLALCLVRQLRRARCQSGGADPPYPQCDEQTLNMHVFSRRFDLLYNSEIDKNNKFAVEYEEQLKLFCAGLPTPRLALTKDGEKLLTIKDTGMIYVNVEILDLQKSKYVCSDVETGCQLSVVISGTPLLEVTSDSDVDVFNRFHPNYTIEYGNSVTVSCSTPDASRSVMTKDGEELITQKVSENTIEYFSSQQDRPLSKYVCTDVDTAADSSVLIKQMPLLYVQQGNQTLMRYRQFDIEQRAQTVAYTYYDDIIEVICCGPRTMDLIGLEDNNNETVKVNATTVKALVSKIKVKEMVFSCIDSEDPSSNSTVYVRATSRVDVISPNVRRIGREYAVKYGDRVDIVCSWLDPIDLTLSDEGTKIRTVQTNNKTTVTYHTYVNVLDTPGFICSTGEYSETETAHVQLLPEAIDWRCVLYDLQEYLNCSWKASSYLVKYTLYYIEDGDFTIMCTQQPSRTSKGIGLCIWDYQGDATVLSFLMQSCSNFGCYNQTFLIDHESIIKLAPPKQLIVRSTSSRGAVLSWNDWDPDGTILYKVVYWYSGINPREVNASLVWCEYWHSCKINLTLPCPAMHYEVKVYRKHKKAIDEEYWSDPSTVTFVTDDDNNKANVLDSTCNWKPKKTKEVMVYHTQMLRYEVQTEMLRLKREVVPLRDKLAYIRYLQKQLTEE